MQQRVEEGGHDIPEPTIRRRYDRGLVNFFQLYKDAVDHWIFINNSGLQYEIIATSGIAGEEVHKQILWEHLKKTYDA